MITCYPPHPETGVGAALCRWCDLTWPVPLATLEAHPDERARFVAAVSSHGLGHAFAGDLWLDATTGEPLDDDAEDDDEEDEQ